MQKVQFTDADAQRLIEALANADDAFPQLTGELRRNRLQLSPTTFRCYVKDELFTCFFDRGSVLETALSAS